MYKIISNLSTEFEVIFLFLMPNVLTRGNINALFVNGVDIVVRLRISNNVMPLV